MATLKYLQRRYEEAAIDLGKLDSSIFSALPVVLYRDADECDRLVMMGLHHISGKRRWPAINRARAMEQLLPHFHNDADAVCEALGVSKREFNLSIGTLAMVNAYRESDYSDQLQSDQFNLFREVLKSEAMRTCSVGTTRLSLLPVSRTSTDCFRGCHARRNRMTPGKTVRMSALRQRPIP